MASLMGKLPGMGQIPDNVKSQMDDKVLVRKEAIINSMTLESERAKPEIISVSQASYRAGLWMQVVDVRLLKQFGRHAAHDEEDEEGRDGEDDAEYEGMMPPKPLGR